MKIRIGRSNYELRWAKRNPDEDAGEMCEEKKIITIYKDKKKKNPEYLVTAIHELVHAECFECGIRQADGWTEDKEEILAENIAQSVVINLPKLKKFLATCK